jgi:DNA-binding transcriptional MerR regulator
LLRLDLPPQGRCESRVVFHEGGDLRVSIGRLAAASGISPKAIRFYEEQGVLPRPQRTASGYRTYGEEDLARLHFVRAAQNAGFSLREIARLIAVRDGRRSQGDARALVTHARRRMDAARRGLRAVIADLDRSGEYSSSAVEGTFDTRRVLGG